MAGELFINASKPSRRSYLRLFGVGALASAGLPSVGAAHGRRTDRPVLRREGEVTVPNSRETVVVDDFAYVATGVGMSVVDLDDPEEPVVVAE